MSKALKVLSVVLSIVLSATILGAYGLYRATYGGLAQEEVDEELLGPRPVKEGESVNVLIIGSDERTGDNARYGRADGARANVLILAHLPPDREGATLVSFPRDSVVELPECEPWQDLPGNPPYVGPINEALGTGGEPCVWRTVEQLTGVHVDHFVKMDMVGFTDIVDAVGGVPMCLPEAVQDSRAKLDLPEGEQVLDGEEALAFVRARYNLGDGTDLGRVERQQMFMSALTQEVMGRELLTSPGRTMDLIGAVTDHLVTDDGLTPHVLASLGYSMRGVDLNDVRFHTVPWQWSQTHEHRVEWSEPQASQLFSALAEDRELPEGEGGEEVGPEPEDIEVVVSNATGVPGLAAEVAAELGERGYMVVETGNAQEDAGGASAVLRHPQGGEGEAARLAEEVEGEAELEEDSAASGAAVEVVLGSSWTGLVGQEGDDAPEGEQGGEPEADYTAEVDPCEEGLGTGGLDEEADSTGN